MTETELSRTAIRQLATEVQGDSPVGACRRVATELGEVLAEHVGDECVDVIQGHFKGDDKLAQHFYVTLNPDVVADIACETEAVVVDATIQQFTKDRFWAGKADTYIGTPPDELPSVGIFTATDREYDRYV